MDIPRDLPANEPENDQQDHGQPEAETESTGLADRELRLHLEQRCELHTRPTAEYSAQIRPHA